MSSKEILAVDDNRDILAVLEMMLAPLGHRVTTMDSGTGALAALAARRFDLVLLDIMMPGLNGLDVLRRLRSEPRWEHLPVIMLTAKARDEDLLRGYELGADYYITKPFTTEQLRYGIELVLGAEGTQPVLP